MEDRKDMKTQVQAEKFRRMPHHTMYQRINGCGKGRLKRSNFTATAKKHFKEVSSHLSIMATAMKDITILPTWKKQGTTEFRESISGIDQKANQTPYERKIKADEYIERQFPNKCWTHVYTDGSSDNATENGGGAILINLKSGEQKKLSIATGRYSNNYRAEAVAIKVAT
jgi:hypothetical protein